jgi:hypothetical protein
MGSKSSRPWKKPLTLSAATNNKGNNIMKLFSKEFALYAGDRALKTFAQALLALIVVGTAINDIDWLTALATAATATVVSLLTSITAATGPTVPSEGSSVSEANTGPLLTEEFPAGRGRHVLRK